MKTIRFGVAAAVTILAGCVGYGYPTTGGGYYGGYPGGAYPGSGYPSYGSGTIRCESEDRRTRRCSANTTGGVRLVRQLSDTRCLQGSNWGYDRGSIWVSNGCRGEFALGGGGGYYPGQGSGYPGYGGASSVRCESNDRRTRRCPMNTRGGVRVVRQLSDTRCVQGRNWGTDRNGIWVSGGCRAEFAAGGGPGDYPGAGGPGQVIRCESNDKRRARCNVRVRSGVQVQRQLSDTRCVQGRNWGYDRNGVWVNGGCRAEFRVY